MILSQTQASQIVDHLRPVIAGAIAQHRERFTMARRIVFAKRARLLVEDARRAGQRLDYAETLKSIAPTSCAARMAPAPDAEMKRRIAYARTARKMVEAARARGEKMEFRTALIAAQAGG